MTVAPMSVPAADGKLRFWRNTGVASLADGQTATLGQFVVGYEVDEDVDNGHRPPGSFRLSSTTVPNAPVLLDYGSVIVHIFTPPERDYYGLEKHWAEAKTVLRVQ